MTLMSFFIYIYDFFFFFFFFFQAEDGIRDFHVTGVQTCALPISKSSKATVSIITRTALVRPSENGNKHQHRRNCSPTISCTHLELLRERRRSEEHTSELQSRENLVCRLLLEKKKKK